MEDLQQQRNDKFSKILNFLHSQDLKVNLFEDFNVDKLFEICIMSVDPKLRGQGIAKQLLLMSEEVARKGCFKV